jgi:hypothetical protein
MKWYVWKIVILTMKRKWRRENENNGVKYENENEKRNAMCGNSVINININIIIA